MLSQLHTTVDWKTHRAQLIGQEQQPTEQKRAEQKQSETGKEQHKHRKGKESAYNIHERWRRRSEGMAAERKGTAHHPPSLEPKPKQQQQRQQERRSEVMAQQQQLLRRKKKTKRQEERRALPGKKRSRGGKGTAHCSTLCLTPTAAHSKKKKRRSRRECISRLQTKYIIHKAKHNNVEEESRDITTHVLCCKPFDLSSEAMEEAEDCESEMSACTGKRRFGHCICCIVLTRSHFSTSSLRKSL